MGGRCCCVERSPKQKKFLTEKFTNLSESRKEIINKFVTSTRTDKDKSTQTHKDKDSLNMSAKIGIMESGYKYDIHVLKIPSQSDSGPDLQKMCQGKKVLQRISILPANDFLNVKKHKKI